MLDKSFNVTSVLTYELAQEMDFSNLSLLVFHSLNTHIFHCGGNENHTLLYCLHEKNIFTPRNSGHKTEV